MLLISRLDLILLLLSFDDEVMIIPILDKDILTVLRLQLIERLKVRIFLSCKVIDGGNEIRYPLE